MATRGCREKARIRAMPTATMFPAAAPMAKTIFSSLARRSTPDPALCLFLPRSALGPD